MEKKKKMETTIVYGGYIGIIMYRVKVHGFRGLGFGVEWFGPEVRLRA